MLVPLDPGVDRLGRDLAVWSIGVFLLETTGDLLRSPLLGQASANSFLELGIIHLADQRTLPPPPFRLPLSLCGIVAVARSVPSQFAANRRSGASDGRGNLLLVHPTMPKFSYAIPLLQRKMICHRWDSIPTGKVCKTSPIGKSQRCFLLHQSARPTFLGLSCI